MLPPMIERRFQEIWSSLEVYHRTLRTPAQRLIWLDQFLEPLVLQTPRPARDRLLIALERERQICECKERRRIAMIARPTQAVIAEQERERALERQDLLPGIRSGSNVI
jgi:hypothetical protein